MGASDQSHLDAAEIEGWADGLLPAARALHLAACPTCLALAERERRLFLALARLAHLAPSPGFADQVMAKTQVSHARERAPKG